MSKGILEALFGKGRRLVLGLLFRQPDETFYVRKIIRMTGLSPGSVQRELKRLSGSGIIVRSSQDSHVYYQANPACPAYIELRSLFIGSP
jgi:DNA-binding HxlR family transcriptional regulator